MIQKCYVQFTHLFIIIEPIPLNYSLKETNRHAHLLTQLNHHGPFLVQSVSIFFLIKFIFFLYTMIEAIILNFYFN